MTLHFFNTYLLSFLFLSCQQDYGQLTVIANTGDILKENSGIQTISPHGLIWAIGDSGNKDHIYGFDHKGSLVREIKLKNAKNKDWEELAKDGDGNLYIGDFGNNDNKRKDLRIYKVFNPEMINADEATAEKIEFYYPEQKNFPPKKKHRLFDAEAFFFWNGNFYIFTKNRAKPFDGTTLLYRVPAVSGRHEAQYISSFKTCGHDRKCTVTAADISPDKKKIALLSHDKVWLLSNFTGDDFFNGDVKRIDLGYDSQKEGICFINEDTLYISDEKTGKLGGNIYRLRL
ncbi:hypothetical protein [Galbibacter pacificus]|uniref:SdiA-regulated family protein n=1 Tax=Galbibacter pacificus TaxID=2996052 RepID=A0ABT6FWD3_9FLAO|nr:hypothetical protein [Galbibacter pacificus]MDG3583982.1 hypothetical protein [Galbibacter pacificus]MDG3587581.1 hypothetical protein [Galbibacter pacificus]